MKYLALGKRIKSIRERAGLSIEQVAERAGVHPKTLERIEANEEQPIIATLIQLSKALSVNVADIFRDRPTKSSFEIVRQGERKKVRPLLQPTKEKIFDYTYELLTTPSDNKHLDAYLIEFAPHQGKRPTKDVTHTGEEFLFLLEGEIHGEIGGESICLKAGDSLFLRSSTAHVFYNPGEKPARAIAVLYPF